MKIIADSALALLGELFSPFGELVIRPGRDIEPADVADADILLVRSITRVDERLLRNSPVRFVGTATSGVDHVDRDYLAARGIAFADAPGCNARAVVEYVLSVLCICRPGWRGETVGILGCGHVGGSLYRCLRGLGVTCRVHDPLLPAGQIPDLMPFAAVLQADILCLHTPLTHGGEHPTLHLIDAAVLAALRPGSLLINAGRGAVIDNRALRQHLAAGANLQVALDVWEGEPNIDVDLLKLVTLGTPHIAGYSREGKERGSLMIRDALCRWLGRGGAPHRDLKDPPRALAAAASFEETLLAVYDVRNEHRRMRAAMVGQQGNETDRLDAASGAGGGPGVKAVFDGLRRAAAERREFSAYRITGADAELARALAVVGLNAGPGG